MDPFSKNIAWRYPAANASFRMCEAFLLQDGVVVNGQGVLRVEQSQNLSYAYQYLCESNHPVLSSSNLVLQRLGMSLSPTFSDGWHAYTNSMEQPNSLIRYSYSVYPHVYSICTSLVITLFLTSFLFTKHYITAFKPSLVMKASCLVASAQLVALNVYSLIEFSEQSKEGKCSSDGLIRKMLSSTGFNTVYVVAFLLLLLTQVDIVKRLYPRRKEKKAIVIIGTLLSITTQVLWAISTFSADYDSLSYLLGMEDHYTVSNSQVLSSSSGFGDEDDGSSAVLSVFVYLLEISISVVYSSLVYVYCFSKWRFAFNSWMAGMTCVMIMAVNAPIVFFIADLADVWVNEFSDMFTLVCYVVSNVTTWEWLNRLEQVEKSSQKDNVLGRPFFADNYVDAKLEADMSYNSVEEESETQSRRSRFHLNMSREKIDRLKQTLAKHRHVIENRFGFGKAAQPETPTPPPEDIYIYRAKEVAITEPAEEDLESTSRLMSRALNIGGWNRERSVIEHEMKAFGGEDVNGDGEEDNGEEDSDTRPTSTTYVP